MSDEQPQQREQPLRRPEPPRRVEVRRSPRYGVFLGGGVVLGALLALVLTYAEPPSQYGYGATLGYLVVALGAVGALVGGLAAVVAGALLDRGQARRSRRRD
ncbi:hypothetical protein [Quadrisphaera sp. KR29]|uniref:hypothetical protein n=1 Tax=Quadrisphaera sp. KR29 TaxID=3461391 RepID=UPI004044BF6C